MVAIILREYSFYLFSASHSRSYFIEGSLHQQKILFIRYVSILFINQGKGKNDLKHLLCVRRVISIHYPDETIGSEKLNDRDWSGVSE